MLRSPGFFAPLFQLSISTWATTRVARVAFALAMAVGGLLAVIVAAFGMAQPAPIAIGALIVAAAGFLLWVVVVRLGLESIVVLSRISERIEEIAEQLASIALDASAASRARQGERIGPLQPRDTQ